MRPNYVLVFLIFGLGLFGCSSGSPGKITRPASASQLNLPPGLSGGFNWQDEYIGPPKYIQLEGPSSGQVASAVPGIYGTVSNLSANGFTLTSPSGSTLNVTFTTGTQVLYQGNLTDVAASPLVNGMNVTVTGLVSGLPGHATERAFMVVINSGQTNRNLVVQN